MNRDITFCLNTDCPLAKDCRRVDMEVFETEKYLSYFYGAYDLISGECEYFYDKK